MTLSRHTGKVLILGASGKVGRMLAHIWQRDPPLGITPVFQHRAAAADGFVQWREGDAIADLPRITAVVALWGATPGAAHAFAENERLALLACEMARTLGADRVFLASSAAVYGAAAQTPLTEDRALPEPRGAYGRSKLAMEQAVAAWAAGPGPRPRACTMRLANVIGADSLFAALRKGDRVLLDRFESGNGPARSYLTAGDLGRVLQALVACPSAALPQVLNVAGSQALAMADLAQAAGAQVGWRPAPISAIERVELDTDRLVRLIGTDLAESSAPGPAIAALRALEAAP